MSSKIMVNPNYPMELANKGGKLVFKKEAEEYLVKLFELKDIVEKAIDEAKRQIQESGTAIDPSFKGVIGDQVKAIYRTFGTKYTYHMNEIDIAQPFLKEKIYYSVDSKAVDKYISEVKELPPGIYEKERTKSISFSMGNKMLEGEEWN